jgi:uncharacterized protein (DUF1810 family)
MLGGRLVECMEALLAVDGRTAHEIFGSPDEVEVARDPFACVEGEGSV